ncbi:MAG: DNA repair protein RecO, partial [Patescibacteria group bacterium]
MNYKTRGIILKRTNLNEADRILTIFTENNGRIKAVAKGIRKTLSKLAGHLELFCLTDFVIAEGRNLDTITAAETQKCFINLRGDLESTNVAYYLAEI